MSLILDLTPEEERLLQKEARKNGLDVKHYARQRLGLPLSEPDAENLALINLLRQWREEDAAMTEEEAEAAEEDWEILKASINEARSLAGEEPVY